MEVFYCGLYIFVPSSIQVNVSIKCEACGSRRNREGGREGFMNAIPTYFLIALVV